VDKFKQFRTTFDFQKTYLAEDVQKPQESKYAAVYLLLISYEDGLVATLILFGGLCLATIRQNLMQPKSVSLMIYISTNLVIYHPSFLIEVSWLNEAMYCVQYSNNR
jgi:hypothetical protein